MSIDVSPPEEALLTAEEFLALPDDGKERWLIRGELRSREPALTYRDSSHGEAEAGVVFQLMLWLRNQPEPRGRISCGGAGFRLERDPDTLIGIDVAYTSTRVRARRGFPKLHEGPPILTVEILSGSDTYGEIAEKVRLFQKLGCVVWIIDPDLRTVDVYRPGQEREAYNVRQELSGEPYLPGFRVPVARIFEG